MLAAEAVGVPFERMAPTEATAAAHLDRLIDDLHARGRLRVWSLVVTVFGDAVLPRGGRIGLSQLQPILGRLRIEPGAVRTALSRLAADGLVVREKEGRSAFYSLTPQGRHAFDMATRVIYAAGPPAWDGRWTVVLRPGGDDPRRGDVGSGLSSTGFVPVGNAAWARPEVAGAGVMPVGDDLLVMEGRLVGGDAGHRLWDLDAPAAALRVLCRDLEPLHRAIEGAAVPEPLAALAARILINHRWRRIVLRVPALPETLLPPEWPGHEARLLMRKLYRALTPAAERWLDDAGLPPIRDPARVARRFGGLSD